jgi:hypothetical protein
VESRASLQAKASSANGLEFSGDEPGAEQRRICPLERDEMKTHLLAVGMLIALSLTAGEGRALAANGPKPVAAKKFNTLADAALATMKKRAAELNVTGVAVVAYAQGDTIQGWSSKMAVVGRMKDAPSAGKNGNNLLGIAYAKAAEMADTLQNSGAGTRPPMTGEFGWQGGVVARTRTGYVIVAFSGGKSEDDVQVSRSGLEVLKGVL